jgi:hypothetical protein
MLWDCGPVSLSKKNLPIKMKKEYREQTVATDSSGGRKISHTANLNNLV